MLSRWLFHSIYLVYNNGTVTTHYNVKCEEKISWTQVALSESACTQPNKRHQKQWYKHLKNMLNLSKVTVQWNHTPASLLQGSSHRGGTPFDQWQGNFPATPNNDGSPLGWHRLETGSQIENPSSSSAERILQTEGMVWMHLQRLRTHLFKTLFE